jgi:carbonic anhydrase
MQIIHQDIFGNLAGVAVLFNMSVNENMFLKQLGFGVDNPLYAMRLRNSETVELKPSEHLNLGKYLNQISHYVHYVGSITSPPCNDNVQWFVLLEKLGVTQKQLDYFPVLFGMESNVRGLQVNKDRLQEII